MRLCCFFSMVEANIRTLDSSSSGHFVIISRHTRDAQLHYILRHEVNLFSENAKLKRWHVLLLSVFQCLFSSHSVFNTHTILNHFKNTSKCYFTFFKSFYFHLQCFCFLCEILPNFIFLKCANLSYWTLWLIGSFPSNCTNAFHNGRTFCGHLVSKNLLVVKGGDCQIQRNGQYTVQ